MKQINMKNVHMTKPMAERPLDAVTVSPFDDIGSGSTGSSTGTGTGTGGTARPIMIQGSGDTDGYMSATVLSYDGVGYHIDDCSGGAVADLAVPSPGRYRGSFFCYNGSLSVRDFFNEFFGLTDVIIGGTDDYFTVDLPETLRTKGGNPLDSNLYCGVCLWQN